MLSEEIPEEIEAELAEALALESQARDLSFLADLPEPLCGTAVLPLDLRNLVLLTHAGSPFVCGGRADIEDVRMALWLQSPLYVAVEPPRRLNWWGRLWQPFAVPPPTQKQAFIKALPPMDEAAAVAETRAWFDATFADAPAGKGLADAEAEEGAVLEEPISSFVAGWADLIGSAYGWTDEYIVGTAQKRGIALRKLFQYYRCILRRQDPEHPFSSATVARIYGDWLRQPEKAEST